MSESVNSTYLRSDSWRAILPARWLPILCYLEVIVGLQVAFALHQGDGMAPFDMLLNALAWSSLYVPLVLAAMLGVQIRIRFALFIGLVMLKVVYLFTRGAIEAGGIEQPGQFFYSVADGILAEIRIGAFLSVIAHALSSLLGVFATSRSPGEKEISRCGRSEIAEWLYFFVLFGFIFLPSLPLLEERRVIEVSWLEAWSSPMIRFYMLFSYFLMSGLPLCGILTLLVRPTMLVRAALLLVVIGLPLGALFSTGMREWVLDGKVILFFAGGLLASIPPWLLLRCAGYRLYSPRRWICRVSPSA